MANLNRRDALTAAASTLLIVKPRTASSFQANSAVTQKPKANPATREFRHQVGPGRLWLLAGRIRTFARDQAKACLALTG